MHSCTHPVNRPVLSLLPVGGTLTSAAPVRIGGARSRRARHLAACTTLVLCAGTLLSAPASAEDRPTAPNRQTTAHRPVDDRQPTLLRPPRTGERRGVAGRTGVAAKTAPRFDPTGDGLSDILFRAQNGKLLVATSDVSAIREMTVPDGGAEMFKDLVVLGDQDGDGTTEILALSSDGTLSLRSASGPDRMTSAHWSGKGWQEYNKLVAPGDLTGGGTTDLLARTPEGQLYLYRANGRLVSPFAARVKIGGGWQVYDQIVGVNDANGDGHGDLYARTPAGDLYFYAGTGNAAAPFAPREKVGYGYGIYNQLLSSDDYDGDGYADLLARTPAGDLFAYRSDGTGHLLGRITAGTRFDVASLFAGAGSNPHFGKSELVGLDGRGTLYLYYALNNGQLSPRISSSDEGGFAGARLFFASSLDNNGRAELLEIYQGRLYNYDHSADGGTNPAFLGPGWDIYSTVFGPGDLDGDGKGDLLARDRAGVLYLYPGDGTGYRVGGRIRIGAGWNAYDALVGAGDFTGDGRSDIVARTPGGALSLYAGTGVAGAPFKAPVHLGGGWNAYVRLAAPGDIDGDGRADLLAVDSRGDLYRYLADGTGRFTPRVKIGNGWNTYSGLF